jgi:hypothetical protein
MSPDEYMKIEGSVQGSCGTSANTIERVRISCVKTEINEKSLGNTLKEMGFHKIEIDVPSTGNSLLFTAERIVKASAQKAETNE